ncbi:hypothetical protein LOTGIDRAFT_176833, partial [Lottia gigantea]
MTANFIILILTMHAIYSLYQYSIYSYSLYQTSVHILNSIVCENVHQDYTVVQCKEHLIPVQDEFEFDKFVGNWNVLKKTVYISGDKSTISQQRYIIHTNNGELLSVEKGFSPVNSCQPTAIRELNLADRAGHYTTVYNNRT